MLNQNCGLFENPWDKDAYMKSLRLCFSPKTGEGLEPVRNIVRSGAERVKNYFSPPPARSWAARNAPMLAAAGLLGGAGLYSMMGDD